MAYLICRNCGVALRPALVDREISYKGHMICMENVEAYVCPHCRACYFTAEMERWMEDMLKREMQCLDQEEVFRDKFHKFCAEIKQLPNPSSGADEEFFAVLHKKLEALCELSEDMLQLWPNKPLWLDETETAARKEREMFEELTVLLHVFYQRLYAFQTKNKGEIQNG